jgi:hypothetical protein
MYPAATIAATIAASVSVDICLKIKANTLERITNEPIVGLQYLMMISSTCLNLLTGFLVIAPHVIKNV